MKNWGQVAMPRRSVDLNILTYCLGLVWLLSSATAVDMQCQQLADTYLTKHHREPVPYTGDNMVYFLHVPRTAGRTFHSCFLKSGTPPDRRCPKAYDHLRINVSIPNCYLLSSHDDFSVVAMLPEDVAVLTHIRDPIDRFLSAYEFAVEVAARIMKKPANFRKNPAKIATEDVWPWSYLVPFFSKDQTDRAAKKWDHPHPVGGHWIHVKHPDGDEYYYNKVLGKSVWNLTAEQQEMLLPPLDPYNNPLVLTLEEFVRHPIAHELIHNGETFQVLGITNYSHWGDAGPMRTCVWSNEAARSHMLDLALSRVDKFIHVGTTNRLAESVAAAGVAMKFKLSGPAYAGDEDSSTGAGKRRIGSRAAAAADLPSLASKVREARMLLQGLQKNLYSSHQTGGQGSKDHEELRSKVEVARKDLRDSQEALAAARATLPKGAGDPSVEIEAGAPLPLGNGKLRTLGQPLGAEYQVCAQRAQQRNAERRDSSLANIAMPDGRTIRFSKAARAKIPRSLIEEIRQLNQLDTALHARAEAILSQHRTDWQAQSLLEDLGPEPPAVKMAAGKAKGGKVPKFNIPKPLKERGAADEEPEL